MDSKPSSLDALRIDRSQAPLKSGGGGKIGWILLILLLLIGAGAWWFMRPKGIAVKTATVQVRTSGGSSARTLLNASGYVTARVEATVSSKITGKVMEILVEEGMKVENNQVVAKLDASNAQSGLRLAEAQLASAKLNLAETEPMLKHSEAEMNRLNALGARAVSTSEVSRAQADARTQEAKLERLKADVTVAERQVDDWKQQVDDTIIRAPFAGVVTTKDSQPGEMISPMSAGGGFTRTGICTLVDMASLEIEVDVGESFINRVTADQSVEATLDAYPEWKIPCKVIAIIPTADRQKATVKVRVAFEKLDPRILPQMGVKVAFQSAESEEPATTTKIALSVSKEAVQKDDGRDVAWVVQDGKVERRAITVSNVNGTTATLTAGLSQGETVVLNPPSTLTDGAAVTVETPR
ncbi:MAG: efflux RND transporter periplasmic adaptor subunit [Verrucomicrobiota bacterium]